MTETSRDPEAWWGLLEAVGLGLTNKPRAYSPDLGAVMDRVPGLDAASAAQVRDAFARAFVEAAVAGDLDNLLDRTYEPGRSDRIVAAVLARTHWPSGVVRPADEGLAIAQMFVAVVDHWTSLWDEPMAMPQVDMSLNGMIDSEDVAFLRSDLAANDYRLVAHHPQGGGAAWDLVFSWRRDDLSHLGFDTFLTLSVQRIAKHFKDRGKPAPDRILLTERDKWEPVLVIEVEEQEREVRPETDVPMGMTIPQQG